MKEIDEYNEENNRGDEYVKKIIEEADMDGDGGLDYSEFCYMMLAR